MPSARTTRWAAPVTRSWFALRLAPVRVAVVVRKVCMADLARPIGRYDRALRDRREPPGEPPPKSRIRRGRRTARGEAGRWLPSAPMPSRSELVARRRRALDYPYER